MIKESHEGDNVRDNLYVAPTIVASTENLNESEEQNNKAVATLACKK